MPQEEMQIPLFMVGAEDVPIVFSNLMVAQHEQQEFILTFAQYTPPFAFGPPDEAREQIQRMPYLPVKVVARIGMTPQRLRELIGVLQENYNRWEEKQRG